MFRQLTKAGLAGLLLASSLAAHAAAQESHAWLDPKLLAAAKAEGGTMTIYSSTNEGEGLPLWALFTKATGIKVNYVRGADSILISRMMLEYRGNQKSWDIAQTATINKMLPQLLVKFDPPEAKNIMPEARDPGKLWYGVYANYNTPDYNTQHVKAADLPKTYEDFAKHPEWAGHVAIDGTDNEWLKAMFEYYGDDKATKIVKDIVATVKPIVTNGHLAAARSVGSGERIYKQSAPIGINHDKKDPPIDSQVRHLINAHLSPSRIPDGSGSDSRFDVTTQAVGVVCGTNSGGRECINSLLILYMAARSSVFVKNRPYNIIKTN